MTHRQDMPSSFFAFFPHFLLQESDFNISWTMLAQLGPLSI